jgi:SAM-dependent methyltransferase
MTDPAARSAAEWDSAYQRDDPAPWDIGRPQPVFQTLADQGAFVGALLDAGCGTGEHTLLAASCGATAMGVDLSPAAIDKAREKAAGRGLSARFEAGDILEMSLPSDGFDTVVDSGLFHVFDDGDRARYVSVLADAVRSGGMCYLACFSDRQPGDWGPRRVTREELFEAFSDGWSVEQIDEIVFEINPLPEVPAVAGWLATIRRD